MTPSEDIGLSPNLFRFSREVVHADQQGVCASMNEIIGTLPETIPNCRVISSAGCEAGPDRLHFSMEGYKKLCERYAEQMLLLLNE